MIFKSCRAGEFGVQRMATTSSICPFDLEHAVYCSTGQGAGCSAWKKMQLLVLLATREESMYKVAERKQFPSFLQNKARFVKYNSSLLNQSGNTIIHEINALLTNAYTKTVD